MRLYFAATTLLSAAPGEISADRKKLVVTGEAHEWAFSIGGLAK